MAEIEALLSTHPNFSFFYLRYKNSQLIFEWEGDYDYNKGNIMIDQGTGKVSGSYMSDVALYCLYNLFHHSDFFYPAQPSQNKLVEGGNTSKSQASPFGVDWSKAQIEKFEHLHKLLQGIFGPNQAHEECVLLTFSDFEKPKGFTSKTLPSYFTEDRSLLYWPYVDIMPSLCFSDGEIVKLHDTKHPYLFMFKEEMAKYPAKLSKDLARLDHDSFHYNFLYNHLPYITHLQKQKNIPVVMNTKNDPKAGYLIESLEVLPVQDTGWRIRRDERELISVQSYVDSPLKEDLKALSEDVFCHAKTSTLYFHGLDSTFAQMLESMNTGILRDHRLYPGFETEWLFEANEALDVLKEKDSGQLDLGSVSNLDPKDLRFHIHFDSTQPEWFGVELQLPNGGVFHHCPREFSNFIDAINLGITAALDEDKESWVSSRRGDVRQGELKIYRHRGLVLQVLLKMLDNILAKQPLSEKAFWASFKNDLGESINRVACGLKAEKNFKSPRFEQLLKAIYEQLRTSNTTMIFAAEESFELSLNVYHNILFSLLRFLAHIDIKHLTKSNGIGGDIKPLFEHSDFNYFSSPVKEPVHSFKVTDLTVLPSLIPHLPENAEVFLNGEPLSDLAPEDLRSLVQVKENSDRIDWFELDPRFYFKGEEITLEEALKLTQGPLVEFRGKYYRIDTSVLPNIKWLEFLWNRLQNLQSKSKSNKSGSNIITLPRSASLEMLALRAAGLNIDGGEQWNTICREFDALSQHRNDTDVPELPEVTTPLKDYQKIGVQWMLDLYQLHLGGILADDMGLGKTLQTLSFLSLLLKRGELGSSLVVVPTSLVYNWLSEIQKFTPELKVQVFEASFKKDGQLEKDGLVICSYGLFQKHSDYFETQSWNVVIFDEAQNLKNLNSLRCNKARALPARSKFCLTGTPLENHYGEFYALIDLVVPGALGPYAPFMSVYGPKKGTGIIEPKDIEFLKLKTQPLVLRRDKKRVLSELPPKTENVILVPFEKQQEKIYREIAVAWNDRIREQVDQKGEAQSQLQMLTALLRLRQVCSHPASLPNVSYKKMPPKVEMLIEQAEAILDKGESVLVFTNFTATLHYIDSIFEKHHHKALTLHGGMTGPQRRKVLAEFENSEQPIILIMTLKTGGVGLNLTKANHVFHLEPWWNPAAENQGTDRVHRMGQEQHVHVVRFVMENSIEEKIQSLKLSKTQCFDALFSESVEELDALSPASFAKKQLSKADFDALLNLDQIKAK